MALIDGIRSGGFSALQRAENSSIGGKPHPGDQYNVFQCSSASRKFLNDVSARAAQRAQSFQCSSASRKFLNFAADARRSATFAGFSALQRAENSSIPQHCGHPVGEGDVSVLFSEPKIPQSGIVTAPSTCYGCFSALQRAENSSIVHPPRRGTSRSEFQCSSASRKFLNRETFRQPAQNTLFQCSSASRKFLNFERRTGICGAAERVSVLFSEPKIPQCSKGISSRSTSSTVSVLFSEPKIPQSARRAGACRFPSTFQCSSASRKFLNYPTAG